jgi:hypothetical protein
MGMPQEREVRDQLQRLGWEQGAADTRPAIG